MPDVIDLSVCLQQRECELQHLNEEKNCLVSKVAHLTCRLENETCQLQNQLAETKCRLEKEVHYLILLFLNLFTILFS